MFETIYSYGKPLYIRKSLGFLEEWDNLSFGIYRSPYVTNGGMFEIIIRDIENVMEPSSKTFADFYYISCIKPNQFKRALIKSGITISECLQMAADGVVIKS